MIKNDNTDKVKAELQASIMRSLEVIGILAESEAKLELENDPRRIDTGRLRNSISHKTEKDKVHIGTNVEYAPYVHFGTVKMRKNEFLKNAVEKNMKDYRAIFEAEMKK